MGVLYGIEELSVGLELNDVGQIEERRSPLPSFLATRHRNDPPLPQMNLAEHHVPGSKDTYYIPDFVTADEESYLLRKVSLQKLLSHPRFNIPLAHKTQIRETPQPKWKQLSNRRYVMFGMIHFWCQRTGILCAPGCRHGVTSKTPLPQRHINLTKCRIQVAI